MNLEIILHYICGYFLPAIYLYVLGTYILVRSYPYKTAKLLAGSIVLCAIGYTLDFFQILLPTEFNFIHLVVLVIFTLSFALIIQIIHDIVKAMKPLKIPRLPHFLYGFFILLLCVNLLVSITIQMPSSEKEGSVGLIFSSVSIGMCAIFLVLLYIGYNYAKSTESRSFFKICITFTVIMFSGVMLWQFDLVRLKYIVPATPVLLLMTLTVTVISYLMVTLNILPSAGKRYSDFMNSSATPMVILNQHKQVLEVNESGKQEFNISVHTDFRQYFNYHNEPAILDQLFAHLDEQLYTKGFRIDYVNEMGSDRIVLIDASKVNRGEATYYYCMIHEVTIEFQRRNLNEHLASHDVLTGINNRTYFEEEVKRKLAQSAKRDGALMICDLNFFKKINDTYGHQTGDNVLIFTANCWREHLPKPHILARLGGDEFVMFFEQIGTKEQFLIKIDEARHTFKSNLYKQDDLEIEIVPSVGIAFVEEEGNDYEHLYHICDIRMYEDKKIVKEDYLIT